MSSLKTKRRARRRYRCDNDYPPSDAYLYGHPDINPGDSYLRLALPPHDNDIGNTTWWTLRYCHACADEKGYW
jgi:hypothetical protein